MNMPLPRTNSPMCIVGVPFAALVVARPLDAAEPIDLLVAHAGERRREPRDLVHDLATGACSSSDSRARSRAADVTSQSARPASGCMTLRTREMRRSALVNVPSFSRNDEPGRNTCRELRGLVQEEVLHDHALERRQRVRHVMRVGIGLRDVLALDVERLELPSKRGVEHVRDAQAGLRHAACTPHSFSNSRAHGRVRRRAGSPAARAGTSPCRTSPARCSGRAAGSRRRLRGRCCPCTSRGSRCR